MRFGITNESRLPGILAAATLLVATTGAASAEEALRWKFKQGEKLSYVTVQDMTITITIPAGPTNQGGQINNVVQQTMEMGWNVQGVNDAGDAVIELKFERVHMKITPPQSAAIEYDSKSDKPAEGLAAMIAPLFDALTAGDFEITMTARGEVKDVKIPQQLLDSLKKNQNAAAMGDIASADGIEKMIKQMTLVFPEKPPQPGDEWSTKVDVNNPMTGNQVIETNYKFDGVRKVDGVSMAVLKPSIKMQFEGTAAMRMNVKDQKSEGEALFNVDAGRLDSIKVGHDLDMDVTIAATGQTMQQHIHQMIDAKVTAKTE